MHCMYHDFIFHQYQKLIQRFISKDIYKRFPEAPPQALNYITSLRIQPIRKQNFQSNYSPLRESESFQFPLSYGVLLCSPYYIFTHSSTFLSFNNSLTVSMLIYIIQLIVYKFGFLSLYSHFSCLSHTLLSFLGPSTRLKSTNVPDSLACLQPQPASFT